MCFVYLIYTLEKNYLKTFLPFGSNVYLTVLLRGISRFFGRIITARPYNRTASSTGHTCVVGSLVPRGGTYRYNKNTTSNRPPACVRVSYRGSRVLYAYTLYAGITIINSDFLGGGAPRSVGRAIPRERVLDARTLDASVGLFRAFRAFSGLFAKRVFPAKKAAASSTCVRLTQRGDKE